MCVSVREEGERKVCVRERETVNESERAGVGVRQRGFVCGVCGVRR